MSFPWLRTDLIIPAEEIRTNLDWKKGRKNTVGIYRLYDRDGVLLYIGLSRNVLTRAEMHVKGKDRKTAHFHQEVERVLISYAESRAQMYGLTMDDFKHLNTGISNVVHLFENYMIHKLKPKYNERAGGKFA